MNIVRCRAVVLMTLCMVVALVSAQVTFSRDWSGGKRAPPQPFDCAQLTRLCRQFIHELRQAMSEKMKHHPGDDAAFVYDDEK